MNRITGCLLVFTLLAAPACLRAQTAPTSVPGPLSRLALQGGIGIGGINMQAAVEANRYLNVRAVGNYFS